LAQIVGETLPGRERVVQGGPVGGFGDYADLLAGYAGLVSMGQQVFVGLGAYGLFFASISLKVAPFWVLPVAPLLCAAVAAIVALFMFRLREAYFAIGTWVFSEVVSLLISKTETLGGERGVGLPTARLVDPRWLEPLTFWISAAIAVTSVLGTYALLRSRVGLGLMTVRDNDVAAASIGVDVWRNRFVAHRIEACGRDRRISQVVASERRACSNRGRAARRCSSDSRAACSRMGAAASSTATAISLWWSRTRATSPQGWVQVSSCESVVDPVTRSPLRNAGAPRNSKPSREGSSSGRPSRSRR
jgi:hypothetical protein